jgi:sterol desaturase/sphingolipid hydroxylase (fatty acid hydroxylase superfamily)
MGEAHMLSKKMLDYSRYLMIPGLGVAFGAISMAMRGTEFAKSFPYYHTFITFFILITLERVWSYRHAVSQRHMIWRDLISTAVQTFVAGAIMGAIVLPVLHYLPETFLGRRFLFGLSNQLGPLWVQVLSVFLLSSLWQYWMHRFEHTNDFLWKLHGYHHSVTYIQISNVLVSNPMDWALRNVLGGLTLGIIGFNPFAIVLAGVVGLGYGDFSHCGADVKGGWLNYIFNGPEVHRWHHSTAFPDDPKFRYGCNFGVGVTFWDLLFGTFYLPKDAKGAVIPPPSIGHPEGYPDEPIYWKMLIGLRAFPSLERMVEGNKAKPEAVTVPAE